jgi:hypothetical protein
VVSIRWHADTENGYAGASTAGRTPHRHVAMAIDTGQPVPSEVLPDVDRQIGTASTGQLR